jgi:3-oxoadipate enol-lactonase
VDGPDGAPVVIALHGIATHSALWAPQLPFWAGPFRLVRVDLPGHGRSPNVDGAGSTSAFAEWLCALLDELRIERAAVVGLSLGGMVAQAFALAYPSRVRSLVLAHTGARSPQTVRDLWDKRLEQMRERGMESQIAASLARWFTPAFAARSPLTLAWAADMVRRTSPEGYQCAAAAIRRLDHLDDLGKIACPTLVVCGDNDGVVPVAAAEGIAAAVQNGRLSILRDAAHLGNVEQPVAFTETVGEFLAATASA